jgi:CBS domain containing-hemolysin-like protein
VSVVSTVVTLVALVVVLVLSAVLGAADAAIGVLTRARVRRLAAAERRGAADLDRIMENPGRVLAARAFVSAVAYAASSAFLTWMLDTTYPDIPMYAAVLVALAIATTVLFALGEALPRAFALHSPERVGLAMARPALVLSAVVYPLAHLLSVLWTWSLSLVTGRRGPATPWVTFEEYEERFEPTTESRDESAREALLESVERFDERIVREVMVPRTDMRCLEDSASAAEALELIREAGFSRLPVFHENLDDIRGVLYARDLLLALGDGWDPDLRISRLTRPAYFVPETKPVRELLVQMRRTAHLALVADEYGGTAGLVTIEDLLEEIVGEIFDEYDRQVPLVVDVGEGRYRVDARLPIDELNELFETDIEREADSVGGLFIEEAGHIPEAGESVVVEGLRLIVRELEGNRILQIIVEAVEPEDSKEGLHEGDHPS